MALNKKILNLSLATLLVFVFFAESAFAQQYPKVSGNALFEFKVDRITSKNKDKDIPSSDSNVYIDAKVNLEFNKNWSVITNWAVEPVGDIDQSNPERYRTILANNRGLDFDREGLYIEQLKGQFENEDIRFTFGKFNPAFGTAFRKEKRIGVFLTDFTRDYELREKIGVSGSALLENSEISASLFFNDTTGLSNSAIEKRGREKSGDGRAGNNSNLSSYSIAMEGQDLFNIEDLFYNIGYRNLNVENIAGRDNETGYVGGLEYSYPIGLNSSIIPFIEVAKINNMSGEVDRDTLYTTLALVGRYNKWTASVSHVTRKIRQKNFIGNIRDRQLQYSVGYKFTNNIAVDISRVGLKENNNKETLMGAVLSYMYTF
jgi:hypothetical protein